MWNIIWQPARHRQETVNAPFQSQACAAHKLSFPHRNSFLNTATMRSAHFCLWATTVLSVRKLFFQQTLDYLTQVILASVQTLLGASLPSNPNTLRCAAFQKNTAGKPSQTSRSKITQASAAKGSTDCIYRLPRGRPAGQPNIYIYIHVYMYI